MHRYIIQGQCCHSFLSATLFFSDVCVLCVSLHWSGLQLVVTLDVVIASVCVQPSCCLRARGRHVQKLLLMIC